MSPQEYQRWYDRDPALKRALDQLRNASDRYQAQVALNIIKIVIEHKMEDAGHLPGEELAEYVNSAAAEADQRKRRRWYDVNETLRSAMQLLQDCPDELQQSVIPAIVSMIEDTLQTPLEE